MFPTTATIRAEKRDRVAGGQQQLPTGKVVPDCYNISSSSSALQKNIDIFTTVSISNPKL
jgi:hypothetical protein